MYKTKNIGLSSLGSVLWPDQKIVSHIMDTEATTPPTRKRRRVFTGRQRPKTLTTLFGFTAQTRRLRQSRPAAATAADQNSLKFGRWGRWKPKESQRVVVAAAAGGWCLELVRGCAAMATCAKMKYTHQLSSVNINTGWVKKKCDLKS